MAVQTYDQNRYIFRAKDNEGNQRLVIIAPEPESQAVIDMTNTYSSKHPKTLANDFQRSAMLIRLAIYLLAVASAENTALAENNLTDDMERLGTKFNKLYCEFCHELQKLMVFSFEMFKMFRTACLYYDDGDEKNGAETLEDMRKKTTHAQQMFSKLQVIIDMIQEDAKKLTEKLTIAKGEEKSSLMMVCLSESNAGVKYIEAFLSDQETTLENMHKAFDLKTSCSKMQMRLTTKTFKELIKTNGFLSEIEATIIRCVMTKKLSESFTKELALKKDCFTQMASACPSPTVAKHNIPDLISEFNGKFPNHRLNKGVVGELGLGLDMKPVQHESFCVLI